MDTVKRYFFITLAFFPILEYLFEEFIGRSFANLFGLAGLFYVIVLHFSGHKLKYPKYLLPLILLSIYYFVWDVVQGEVYTSQFGYLFYFYYFKSLHLVFFLVLVENTEFDEKFIKTIINIFKVTIVFAFIVSLIQNTIKPFFFMTDAMQRTYITRSQYEIRSESIFGYLNPNELGFSFISIISILIGYYLYKKRNLNISWLLMAGFVFLMQKSRYVYLNFAIILFQYPLLLGIQIKKVFKISGLVIVSLVFIAFLMQKFVGFSFEEFYNERILSSTASTRVLGAELFFKFFPNSPIFGSGVHVGDDLRRAFAGRSGQIHNGYLSHLYEFGIVGSILLFTFWYQIGRDLYRSAIKNKYYGSFFAFITFLATNLTDVEYMIIFYGLMFAFVFDKFVNDQVSQENIYEHC